MKPWRSSLDQTLTTEPDPHEFHAQCEACGCCIDCDGCQCSPMMEDAG